MQHLSINFLGGFEARLGAEPVTGFATNKIRALLSYLAIEAYRPHSRAELSAMFWPDASEKKAAHSLSQGLLQLRRALREIDEPGVVPFLLVTQTNIQFNGLSGYRLDVTEFRELAGLSDRHIHVNEAQCETCHHWLQKAADIYRGDLLAGLFLSNCDEFEEWKLVQQEALHQQALEILEWLAVFHENKNEWDRVQNYARRQIALEPWREVAHFQLMRALVQSGQTLAAIKQYETFQQILSEELGLKPSGEILQFYDQIKSGSTIQPLQPTAGETAWLPVQGERRQVTTLICGRDSIDHQEEASEQEMGCEQYCQPIFNRFGGRRAPRQGSACLVYFGYPQAYEDAARRAVHSGLAMATEQKDNGAARIGIHTGTMLVGEGQSPRWQERDLSGLSVDVARECQRLAQPGQVLITEDTWRLVQPNFNFEDPSLHLAGPGGRNLQIYRVREELNLQSRLDWLAETQRLTPFTGREGELDQLMACYKRLLQGGSQVVVLSGEPGIGKSRLVWEFKIKVQAAGSVLDTSDEHTPVQWITSSCLPHYQDTPLFPIIGLFEQLIGIQPGDSLETRRGKLQGMLAWYGLNRPATEWLLSTLLGLRAETSAPQTITPAQREQMRVASLELLQKRAAEQPLVLVIEDLHWSDPSTVEWLAKSLDTLESSPCLILLTARPGFTPSWLVHQELQPDLLHLRIVPLSQQSAKELVSGLVGETELDENTLHYIITQTDGIPFFIEELTKGLLEDPAHRIITGAGGKKAAGIPVTLQDALAARLDLLGAAKETAQWAATLGREFYLPVLQACIPYDEQRVQDDLARLIQAELISPVESNAQDLLPLLSDTKKARKQSRKAPVHYAFKHALLQEAVYSSLLKRTCQAYHRRIADKLTIHFPQMVESRPELIAQHYANAGLQTQAADLWLQAGERATSQGATLEALTFFGLVLENVPPSDYERHWKALLGREHIFDIRAERDAQKKDIDMLMKLAAARDDTRRTQVLLLEIDFALKRRLDFQLALPVAEEAIATARKIGNLAFEVKALAGKLQILFDSGDQAAAHHTAEEILAKLAAVQDDDVQAYSLTKVSLFYLVEGDLDRAVQLLQKAQQAARQAGDRYLESRITYNLSAAYILLGLYAQAHTALEKVEALAESIGDYHYVSIRNNPSYLTWCLGDRDLAILQAEENLSNLRRPGESPYYLATCLAHLGCYLEDAGNWSRAVEYLEESQAVFLPIGDKSFRIKPQAVEARCLLHLNRLEVARALIIDTWRYIRERGTTGIDSPSQVFLCIADVAGAIDIPEISAHEVIEAGYRDMMLRAEKISNPEWRRSFLYNVAENRSLTERWEKNRLQIK